jgi:hypothetical protein
LLSLGLISSPAEATPDLINQYETQIIGADMAEM